MPHDLEPNSLWMNGLLGPQGSMFCLLLRHVGFVAFVLLLLLMGRSCLFLCFLLFAGCGLCRQVSSSTLTDIL